MLLCIAQIGGAHVSLYALAGLGSTIASMKAPVLAHVPRLAIAVYKARPAIERRRCIYGAVIRHRWCTKHACTKYGGVLITDVQSSAHWYSVEQLRSLSHTCTYVRVQYVFYSVAMANIGWSDVEPPIVRSAFNCYLCILSLIHI